MKNNAHVRFLAAVITLFLLSIACSIPTAPLSTPAPTNEIVQPTKPSTDLPVPTTTNTPQESSTIQPTPDSPPITPTIAGAISSANVTTLAPADTIVIPQWPERLLWPGFSITIPSDPLPRPDLVTNSGPSLYPITVDPLAIGSAITLPLNGSQILAFAPDASSLVVQDPSQTGVYTLEGQQLRVIPRPAQPYSANYSPDGRYLAVLSSDNWEVTIYDVASGLEIQQLSGFETAAPVYNAIIAPGGKTLAYYARATLQFQDVETGQLSNSIFFEDFIGSILFSPDGQRLILNAADKLMIYDPNTAEQLSQTTLSEPLLDMAVSTDGTVVIGIYGQNLQIWDANTLSPITTIKPQTSLAKLSISPDGKHIVTLSNENQITIWTIP